MTTSNPCNGFPLTRYSNLYLDPTVVDDNARKVFTTGWCWALAEALNTETGWPMMAVYSSGFAYHVAVEHPGTKLLVDIYGLTDAEEIGRRFDLPRESRAKHIPSIEALHIGEHWALDAKEAAEARMWGERYVPATLALVQKSMLSHR